MLDLLLIGSGKWGRNYISTLYGFKNVNLIIANRNNWQTLIDQKPNGVIISTLPDSHIEIAEFALERNIPTMIEKPLALTLKECQKLEKFAAPILVNHIHLFSNTYQYIKKQINIETIYKITSTGINKGPIRNYSSLLDYGPHDLSMILDILSTFPNKIKINEVKTGLFKINLNFDKCYSESIVGNGSLKPSRKLKIYTKDKDYTYDGKTQVISPLTTALKTFIRAIEGEPDSRLGIDLALQVVRILENYEC